mmetsp:Transcript_50611/g.50988  ORF Transcript_50611/g.50988 Transcript_50611/m.50988 type:complete len:88 (-) Transcript_50611:134-397(-)
MVSLKRQLAIKNLGVTNLIISFIPWMKESKSLLIGLLKIMKKRGNNSISECKVTIDLSLLGPSFAAVILRSDVMHMSFFTSAACGIF